MKTESLSELEQPCLCGSELAIAKFDSTQKTCCVKHTEAGQAAKTDAVLAKVDLISRSYPKFGTG